MGTTAGAATMAAPTTVRDIMAILGTTPQGRCTEGAPWWCTKGGAAITAGIVTGATIAGEIMAGGATVSGVMTDGVRMANTGMTSPRA